MLVDSHCHLHLIDLNKINSTIDEIVHNARSNQIEHILNVSVKLSDYQSQLSLIEQYPEISFSVGLHPGDHSEPEPSLEQLVQLAGHMRCVAIGETGLDYAYIKLDLEKQQQL